MARFALLPAALLLSLGAASAAPSHFGPPEIADGLSARAGMGGVARPGRWLPVDVTIASQPSGVRGELRVEWGDAVVLRDLDITSGTDQHIVVLLRAIAAAPTVHVAVTSDSHTATIDIPVELAPLEEPLTLCIGEVSAAACTVRIAEDAAPSTWRGFDVADAVMWPNAAQSPRHDATRALATWRAMRWLGDEGPADPVLPPFDARTPAIASLTLRLALLALAIVSLIAVMTWRRARVEVALGLPALIGVTASALLFTPSLLAQRDATSAQLIGVVHQFAGTPHITFAAKGEVEHSSAGPLWISPEAAEATVSTSGTGAVRGISTQDRDGRALYRATAGLGTRRRIAIDGTVNASWLEISAAAAQWFATNHAPFALRDCRWSAAPGEQIGTLPPGTRTALNRTTAPAPDDAIVCALPNDWLRWTTSSARVDVRGQTFFVFHFWPRPQEDGLHAAR